MPFVTFGHPGNPGAHAVVDAVPDALHPAVTHLVEHGHRRIACLAEPSRYALSSRRMTSFSRAAASAEVEEPTVVVAGFHEEDGFAAAVELLTGPNPPSAILAVNDLLALGALRAAALLDVAVPEQLSVVGFDDIPAAALVRPGLTTMHQSAFEIGTLLVEELRAQIESEKPVWSERLITPTLLVRESTGPSRG